VPKDFKNNPSTCKYPLYLKIVGQITRLQPIESFILPFAIRTKSYYLATKQYNNDNLRVQNLRFYKGVLN